MISMHDEEGKALDTDKSHRERQGLRLEICFFAAIAVGMIVVLFEQPPRDWGKIIWLLTPVVGICIIRDLVTGKTITQGMPKFISRSERPLLYWFIVTWHSSLFFGMTYYLYLRLNK